MECLLTGLDIFYDLNDTLYFEIYFEAIVHSNNNVFPFHHGLDLGYPES